MSKLFTEKNPCDVCGLDKGCNSPKMEVSGDGRKKIFVLAEAAGKEEDKQGKQLVGQSGQIVRDTLNFFEIDLDKDCWKGNACKCRPPRNRTPSTKEINCCRRYVLDDIKKYKPEKLIILGRTALLSFLAHRTNEIGKMEKWIGWKIPDQEFKCWVFPTYHPSYLLRNPDPALMNLFIRHIETAVEWDKPFIDYGDENKKIKIIQNVEDACNYLKNILDNPPKYLSFDYETTGLKPDKEGHEVICLSMSTDSNSGVVFPNFQSNKRFQHLLKMVLTNKDILKIAQNLKFEERWTRRIFGYEVNKWIWDTMIGSHVLDNRSSGTSLKLKTYTEFGTIGYEKDIKKYLKSVDDLSNGFNKLREYFDKEPEKVLLYCGLDSMFEYRMAMKQMIEIPEQGLEKGFNLLMDGVFAFSDIEEKGISIDSEYYKKQSSHLGRKVNIIHDRIAKSREVKLYKKERGSELNINSSTQMRELFIDVMDYNLVKKTKKGQFSVDREVLERIDTEFTNDILEYRKLIKTRDTYILGILNEVVNNYMHTFFNLHTARTFRSSASSFNFQNIPKRDEYIKMLVRQGIKPRMGRYLVERDYSGIEVRISACYHKDPVMLDYINDPSSDMHRDEAMGIFMLTLDEMTKKIRYYGKNGWVFPQFYGSYYKQCAIALWECANNEKTKNGVLLIDHLRKHGIRNYEDFVSHLEEREDYFWNEKFKVYNQWRKEQWENYLENGYVELYTGFRCGGLMKRNDVINYAIQGSSFHCLLWSLIEVHKEMKKRQMKSFLIGQIHDSMIGDIVPDELDEFIKLSDKITCHDLLEAFPWIIVPMEVETEISELNGNWYKMEELKT